MINCLLGSEVYVYAVNNGIEYSTIDTREFISDLTYSENEYSGFGFWMGTSARTQTVGHITYGVGSRRRDGDSTTGYYISGGDDNYLLGTVGRFSTRNRNLYFIVNDMPLATDTVDNVFETDIMFNYGGGAPAQLRITDSSGAEVETISAASLEIENGTWYTYKLIYHNGSYYRSIVQKGEVTQPELIKTQSSDSGMQRFDIIPYLTNANANDLGGSQSASVSFDNTKIYTNVEIARLTLDITDEGGDALPNAKVTIGGKEYKSDRNGICSTDVLSGIYDVTVSADGYNDSELTLAVFKGAVEKTIELELVRYPLESISFARDIALKEGQTAKAELVTVPENAEKTVFIYSSSDESVATVDENGIVTAIKAGTATITATAQDNAEIKAECEVTVYEPYNSIVASIVIDGPDTAYIPNNSAANLVQFTARCYDKNGVEIKNANGIKWTANGALAMSAGGVLTVPKGKNAATYTVYASYDGIKSNEEQITLITYPDNSDIIAYEDCTGELGMFQETVSKSITKGDITYYVGARSEGGDKYSGFNLTSVSGRTCLQAKAGRFGNTDGRAAYMVFDKMNGVTAYNPDKAYVLETDINVNDSIKIKFESSDGTCIMQLEPGTAGLAKNTWYHYMLIYSDGAYSQFVTDSSGNYVETQLPTVLASGVVSQIRFLKGDTDYSCAYFYGLKYYTAESAFSTITVKTVDQSGAALSGVTVDVSGNKAVTDANGAAKFTLPLGAYTASATKGEYSASMGVMSTGTNAKYTLVLGEDEVEPITTGIDQVSGKTIYASTNGEGLKLYAAKYTNGVLSDISVFDAVNGTSYYNSGFEPDKVFLWDTMQRPTDIWTK